MRKGILVATMVALASVGSSIACDIHGESGIVEKNDLNIPVGAKNAGGITKEQFDSAIDKVEGIYQPIVGAKGKILEVVRNWDDGTVNAYAQQVGNTWKVSMFGGLARHETITVDGFALVVCHEVGHHLGGLPKKKSWWSSSWASNEGQADYFGTMKCLRKYMEKDDNISMMANANVPAFVTEKCESNFTNASDIAMCQRGALAGLSLGNLFRALRRLDAPLKFDTPDPAVVAQTDDNHPAPQCRLDTYFQGALCEKDHYSDVSDTDANQGVCNRVDQDTDGIRPLCWYKPAN